MTKSILTFVVEVLTTNYTEKTCIGQFNHHYMHSDVCCRLRSTIQHYLSSPVHSILSRSTAITQFICGKLSYCRVNSSSGYRCYKTCCVLLFKEMTHIHRTNSYN